MLLLLLISLLTFVVNVSGTCYPPNNEKIAHTEKCVCPAGKYQTGLNYTFVQMDSDGDGGSTVIVKNDQGVEIMTSIMEGERKETAFEVEPGTYSFNFIVWDAYPEGNSYEILNEYGDIVKYGNSALTDNRAIQVHNEFSYTIGLCSECASGKYQNQTGQTECTECASGFSSPVGSSSCTVLCPYNQYASNGLCESCPSGKAPLPFVIDYTHESVNAENSIGYQWSKYCDVYDTSVSGNANCKAGYTLDDAKDYCSSNDWCVKIMYFGRCDSACDDWVTDRDRYWFLKVGGSSPYAAVYADVYSKRYVSSCTAS